MDNARVGMNVLVVDDDAKIRASVGKFLVARGHTVIEAATGEKGLEAIRSQGVDIVITDVKMPGIDGFEVLRKVKEISPDTEVIVITAVSESENAFRALREGAFDFFNKPFRVEVLNAAIQRTVRYQAVQKEKNRAQERLRQLNRTDRENNGVDAIIGNSTAIRKVREDIQQVAATDTTTVLICGETGTGKELVAKAVHYESSRSEGPFIPVNCSAIPEGLFESEFFGHGKGAFTGASENRKGHFELANGGTLFLDEVGDMPMDMQVRILRLLEERIVRPVGGGGDIPIDVRVIAATNRDLPQAVHGGTFREDLYYRLNVFRIDVPPLREREKDILVLAEYFLKTIAQDLRKDIRGFSKDATDVLLNERYLGNIRMLKNAIERAVIVCRAEFVTRVDLDFPTQTITKRKEVESGLETDPPLRVRDVVDDLPAELMELAGFEKALVEAALDRSHGNQVQAAKLLGISRMQLRGRMQNYGLS